MLDLTGAERSVYIGDDYEVAIQMDYDIDDTFTYTSDIYDPDDLTVNAESFACPVEEVDLSELDPELTGTVKLLFLRLNTTQTALLEAKIYIFDIKEVSPSGFQTHPVTRSKLEAREALTI